MWFGRIGGALVLGGGVACLVAIPIILAGDRVGSLLQGLAQLIFPAALIPIGLGAAILGVAGTRPLDGRSVRAGLAMLGAGLLAYEAANIVPAPDGTNTLQSWPHIVGLVFGALATVAGALVTGLACLLSPRPLRPVGALLVAGLVLLPAGQLLAAPGADGQSSPVARAVQVIGAAAWLVGVAGIGALGLRGDHPSREVRLPPPVERGPSVAPVLAILATHPPRPEEADGRAAEHGDRALDEEASDVDDVEDLHQDPHGDRGQ